MERPAMQQRTLGYEHKDREAFALIRSISAIRAPRTTMSQRRLRGVQKLIETLYAKCSTNFVSHATQRRIAELAIGGAVTERCVRNWQKDAETLGVLKVGPDGREKTIRMDEIRKLVRTSPPENLSGAPEKLSASPENLSAICPVRSPEESPVRTSIPTRFRNPPPPPSARQSGWEEVESQLISAGVTDWTSAIKAARTRVDPAYVLRVLAYYRAAGSAYGPGALHFRLMGCDPAASPEDPATWVQVREASYSVQHALSLLAQARAHPAANGLPPVEFERLFRDELRSRYADLSDHAFDGFFRETMFREALPKTAICPRSPAVSHLRRAERIVE